MFMRKLVRSIGKRDFIRFGIRDRIARFFHNPDSAKNEEFETDFYGLKYRGSFNNFIDWSTFYFGAYSKPELELIADFLSSIENPVFLDVGANVGHHTLFASSRAVTVHSFEPFPIVAAKINQKIEMNKLTNVVIHPVGLGMEDQSLLFHMPNGCNQGIGSFVESNGSVETTTLEVVNGDDYLKSAEIDNVGFIKVDTEGYEPFVLQGLTKTIEKERPVVFFEWSQNSRNGEVSSPVDYFPRDYEFYQFLSDINFLKFFRRKSYKLKSVARTFGDGNFLAISSELRKSIGSNDETRSIAAKFDLGQLQQ